jgi:hypothetical protein
MMSPATTNVRCGGRIASLVATCLLVFCVNAVAASDPAPACNRLLDEFEARLVQNPASLRVAAEYRQLVIETGRYDQGSTLFEHHGFRARLDARADQIPDIIERALDAGVRVDTTLRELYPDLSRAAWKGVP